MNQALLLLDLAGDRCACLRNLTLTSFSCLLLSNFFIELNSTFPLQIKPLDIFKLLLLAGIVLLGLQLCLAGLLMLAHKDGLLDLGLLDVPLLAHGHDTLTVLSRDHLLVLHLLHLLLDLVIVALLELHDLTGTLPRLLNLLARLDLFLLQQGDTIRKQLGIAFHTIQKHSQLWQVILSELSLRQSSEVKVEPLI